MSRFTLVCLFASIAATGCDSAKKSEPKKAVDPVTEAKAKDPTPAAGSAMAGSATPSLAAAAGSAKDVTLQTGALDFELVEHAGTFILRDAAYEMTFSNKPSVTEAKEDAPSGVKLKTLTAMASISEMDAYGLFLLPIPKNVPYNIEEGVKKARDGAFTNMGVKLVSDVDTTVGGIPGRKATATGTISGVKVTVELRIAFDKAHHTMIGLMGLTGSGAFPAATTSFLSSLQIKPGEGPPAGDGT